MEKPMFYFGSCYLWTLMVLSLTGMGMAVGLMVATVPVCIFLIDRLRRPVQGKQKLKFFLAAGAIVLVACIAFLLQTTSCWWRASRSSCRRCSCTAPPCPMPGRRSATRSS